MSTENVTTFYAEAAWHERAAAHLATNAPALARKLESFVADSGEIDWTDLRHAANVWSGNERKLVWLACSFADEVPMQSRPNIADMIGPGLDEASLPVLVEAVRIACTGRVG